MGRVVDWRMLPCRKGVVPKEYSVHAVGSIVYINTLPNYGMVETEMLFGRRRIKRINHC